MTIPNPDHFLEHAAKLAAGRPRQADLRRAISSAYYSVFHFILTAASDEFVGAPRRTSARYALVYRSIDHRIFRDLCVEVRKPHPSNRYVPFFPIGGFAPDLRTFAASAIELQGRRHLADYDPRPRFNARDTVVDITTARAAIEQFRDAPRDQRKLFLTLLLSPPR